MKLIRVDFPGAGQVGPQAILNPLTTCFWPTGFNLLCRLGPGPAKGFLALYGLTEPRSSHVLRKGPPFSFLDPPES